MIVDTRTFLRRFEQSAFHPLMLPMIFAEHERKRFFNAIDAKSTGLEERILELENRVNSDAKKKNSPHPATHGERDRAQTMTQRDCEAISLWRTMNGLKNGLEGLHAELGSMREHLHAMPKFLPGQDSGAGRGAGADSKNADVYIDARLREMMAEFRAKIRFCEGLLGSMNLATQMVWIHPPPPQPGYLLPMTSSPDLIAVKEWNYYTRRDAQYNFNIATATKMDGSQMKQISLMGMIFLPGTFLAVS
jgi:hypothetical protein